MSSPLTKKGREFDPQAEDAETTTWSQVVPKGFGKPKAYLTVAMGQNNTVVVGMSPTSEASHILLLENLIGVVLHEAKEALTQGKATGSVPPREGGRIILPSGFNLPPRPSGQA